MTQSKPIQLPLLFDFMAFVAGPVTYCFGFPPSTRCARGSVSFQDTGYRLHITDSAAHIEHITLGHSLSPPSPCRDWQLIFAWHQDLELMFHHARDRFSGRRLGPCGDEDDNTRVVEGVWDDIKVC